LWPIPIIVLSITQAESGRKVHEMCLLNVYDVKVLKSVLSFKE